LKSFLPTPAKSSFSLSLSNHIQLSRQADSSERTSRRLRIEQNKAIAAGSFEKEISLSNRLSMSLTKPLINLLLAKYDLLNLSTLIATAAGCSLRLPTSTYRLCQSPAARTRADRVATHTSEHLELDFHS
jgi:hypothetical protein